MAEDFESFVKGVQEQAPSTGPVPVPAGSGEDEFAKFVKGAGMPEAPAAAAEPTFDSFVKNGGTPKEAGHAQLLTEGVQRGWAQTKAVVPSLQSIYADVTGDQPEAVAKAQEAKAILAPAGESQWEIKNIKSPEDFSLWLTEKVGEQAANMGLMLATGGVGGLGAKTVAQNLLEKSLITKATADKLITSGVSVPTYLLNSGMEAAGTTQEQFDIRGENNPHGALSLGAGALKGVLETLVPLQLTKSVLNPGSTLLGKMGTAGRLGTIGAEEGATEYAQEVVDILARKYNDPSYSFFGTGATPWYQGEGFQRALEAGATGAAVGAVYGAPFAKAGSHASVQNEPGDWGQQWRTLEVAILKSKDKELWYNPDNRPKIFELYQANGENAQKALNDFKLNPSVPAAPPKSEAAAEEPMSAADRAFALSEKRAKIIPLEARNGPVSELRKLVMREDQGDPIRESLATSPVDDLLSLRPLIASSLPSQSQREAFFALLDANTPRYVEKLPDGSMSNRVMTDTELELHNVLTKAQSERPDLHEVIQGSLQPAAMSAHFRDLAEPGSPRIWFLPTVNSIQAAELRGKYAALYEQAQETSAAHLAQPGSTIAAVSGINQRYGDLLTAGLRVVPSRGAGFHYNGVVGLKTKSVGDLRATSRSLEVGMYDPVTRMITPMRGDEQGQARLIQAGVPVAIDTNMVSEADATKLPDGSIQLKKPLNLAKLTPGVKLTKDMRLGEMYRATSGFLRPSGTSSTLVRGTVAPIYEGTAQKVEVVAKKLLPVIDKILKNLGIDQSIYINVIDDGGNGSSAGWVWTDRGEIGLSPKNFQKLGAELDKYIPNVIMHELGHQITYWYFRNLPTEIQDQVIYAQQKALLSARVRPEANVFPRTDSPPFFGDTYYLSLSEFLAEQFRRWATSEQEAKTWLDRAFREGGLAQEKFFKEWERVNGTRSALDISQPDYHFSAAMEYLRAYGAEKAKLIQVMRQQVVYSISNELVDSPAAFQITQAVKTAIDNMAGMVPAGVKIQLNKQLDPGIVPGESLTPSPDAVARWVHRPSDIKLIELATGSLKSEEAFEHSRIYISHELMHAYEDLGLINSEELGILDKAINDEGLALSPQYQASLRVRLTELGATLQWTSEQVELKIAEVTAREARAHYVQGFADGKSVPEHVKGILNRLLELLEKIGNALRGLGFQTRDDVLRAFFKGEMAQRSQREGLSLDRAIRTSNAMDNSPEFAPDATWKVGNYKVEVVYEDSKGDQSPGKLNSSYVTYRWSDASGRQVGSIEFSNKMPKGFNVEWIETSEGFPLGGMMMIREAEKDLGIKLKPAGELTDAGYRAAHFMLKKRGDESLLSLYRPLVANVNGVKKTMWVSPNRVREQVFFYTALVKEMGKLTAAEAQAKYGMTQKRAIAWLTQWRVIMKKLPESTWTDPRLEQMFALRRNSARDEVQGSLIRAGLAADESKLQDSLGIPNDSRNDAFTSTFKQKQLLSQGENARASGLPLSLSAPSTMLTYESRAIYEWATKYGNNPAIDKKLMNTQLHEKDRIGWFTKIYWGLNQLAARNPHVVGLLSYLQNAEFMNNLSNTWLRIADETARQWDKVPQGTRREAVAEALFKLTEMQYRLPNEVSNETVRLPGNWFQFLTGQAPVANGELDRLFKSVKLDSREHGLIRRVASDFQKFLQAVEQVRMEILQRTLTASPQALQAGIAKLQKEMADLRAKPYFPMVRFGEFTIAVRDPNNNNKVVWASAYGTQRQRDAAVEHVTTKHPGMDVTIGRTPDNVSEFQGLPGPLLRAIKETMLDKAGKTQEQKDLIDQQLSWIEEFEMMNAPDKNFAKRWMPSQDLPGYSPDAFRAYAHYFMSGSRYLSRLKYMDVMKANISDVNGTVLSGRMGNTAKRQAIVKYMRDHFEYIMEGGRDNGKIRAFVSLWFLGFSPAAAAMNLTQIPGVLVPFIAGHFGNAKALSVLSRGLSAGKNQMGYTTGSPSFLRAREEMINQGRIDVGQAPELGAFAEGHNLMGLQAGTKVQKAYRWTSWAGMKMFGVIEHFNRELTFKTVWDLAIANPLTRRLTEIDNQFPLEVADLQRRAGLTHPEALAFMMAKEAIDRTQFQYAKYTDPPFMRGKAKDFLIFFKYTQSMTYAMRFNPGQVQMLLIMAFLYGLNGLPGSEDLSELIRLAGKFFGKDFDLQGAAREYVRNVTRGTIFDKVGPDLMMHGVSRYGFGLGLLPEGYGAPRFDASANGSMGRIVPGLSDILHGANTNKDAGGTIAAAAQKASGAGVGLMFTLMQYLMEKPGSADSHKWEQLLPRAAHAAVKAYRYGVDPQAETTRSGAKIAKFDVNDPDDLATVIAQAFGFAPTKVNEQWEARRDFNDAKSVYQARKVAIYAQFDNALRSGAPNATEGVMEAIRKYNEQVKEIDPAQQISGTQLRQALQQRATQRAMQEQFLTGAKREVPMSKRIQDLYPGTLTQEVK